MVLDPAIRSRYRPRATPARLWKQFYRYGKGKAEMWYANRKLPSLRPLAPMGLILGLALSLAATATSAWWAFPVAAGTWLGYLGVASAARPGLWAAASIMQLSNGLGIAVGLARGPGRVRRSLNS